MYQKVLTRNRYCMDYNDIIATQSGKASTVCRQIVVAIGAFAWALFIKDEISRLLPLLSLISVIFYFVVEIAQYLYSCIFTRKATYLLIAYRINNSISKKEKDEKEKAYILETISIEKRSFFLFCIKVLFCGLSVIPVLIYVIKLL